MQELQDALDCFVFLEKSIGDTDTTATLLTTRHDHQLYGANNKDKDTIIVMTMTMTMMCIFLLPDEENDDDDDNLNE